MPLPKYNIQISAIWNFLETENNEDIFCYDTNYRIINKSSILQLKIHQFFLIELLSSDNEKYLVKIDDLNHFFGWKVKDSVVFHEDDNFQVF